MEEPKLIKRRGITDAAINKQRKILIIAIFCVITLFISTSYALLTNFDKTDNVVVFQTGNLNMSVNNTEGLINLNNKLPESDTDGLANATPIVLTLTNTGTILIQGFDVKLVSENSTTNVSTLSEDYIKYAISLDNGNTYQTPSILSSNDNIIYSGYNLAVDASVTIYLKVWIDENAGNNAINKTYYGSIQVDLYQKADVPLSESIKADIVANNTGSCKTYVEEDGITYISGTADCIDFNYVWYSGKLWRITAIYPDGTMKMITDDNITTISYGEDVNFYTDESNSFYMYQWLNEDFLDTLYNYQNIIVTDASWNATNSNFSSTSEVSTKLPETTMVTAPVGLLNSYEYYKSYQNTSNSNGYLNIGYYWWLLNPSSSSFVWIVYNNGGTGSGSPSSFAGGARPSINLQSGITINGGTGTSDDPYTISGDKGTVTANTTFLNTRQSGEYVNFDGELYRIVEIENNTTKLNKMDYVRDESNEVIEKSFSSSNSYITYGGTGTTDETYWAGYLNNTWYNSISETYKNMLVEGTYYLGRTSSNYKGAICATASNTVTTANCAKTTSIWTGYVGLPRYGEMFASQQGSGDSSLSFIWLITPYSSSRVWNVYDVGEAYSSRPSSSTFGARPSINLSSAVKIIGGTGLKDDPFEISL